MGEIFSGVHMKPSFIYKICGEGILESLEKYTIWNKTIMVPQKTNLEM